MNNGSIKFQAEPGGKALLRVQQGVWFGQALADDDCAYVIGQYTQIDGPLDRDLFIRATQVVVAETEALRLRFEEVDGRLAQHVIELEDWTPLVLDFSDQPGPEAVAQRWMDDRLRTPFDVARPPLFSWALIKLSNDSHLWTQIVHHLILDGHAGVLLLRRVADVYSALCLGRLAPGVDMASMDEFVLEEVSYRNSPRWQKDQDYWVDLLANRPDAVRLSGELLPTPPSSMREAFELSAPLSDALRARARGAGVSVPNILMAAVAIYIHRLTGKRDIVLSSGLLGRVGQRARNTPAMMTNIMPVRLISTRRRT